MYGNTERDKQITLARMMETALTRQLGNHIEAKQLVAQWIANDRRFDGIDPYKLAQRADERQSNGARIDLDDPRLRGEPARPLTKDGYW
jgi:hypothetical protein